MRVTILIAAFLLAAISACGGDSGNSTSGDTGTDTFGNAGSGADTQDGELFPIADGPVSGLFGDEPWQYTRGLTDWAFGAVLCADGGTGCDPCEGKQLFFLPPAEPGTVTLKPGIHIVNFYDGGGGNWNVSKGKIVVESMDDESINGGLFVSQVYSGKKYEASGQFTIQNCKNAPGPPPPSVP